MMLVDGGVIDLLPVIPTKESGADVVLGVEVGSILKQNHPRKLLISIIKNAAYHRGCLQV